MRNVLRMLQLLFALYLAIEKELDYFNKQTTWILALGSTKHDFYQNMSSKTKQSKLYETKYLGAT